MLDLNASDDEFSRLDPHAYTEEVKRRLSDDVAWARVTTPELLPRTRSAVKRLVESTTRQIEHAEKYDVTTDQRWLSRITYLRELAARRMDEIGTPENPVPTSGRRDASLWRAFSAELAHALVVAAPEALERLQAPYGGGMNALEWLQARDAKAAKR